MSAVVKWEELWSWRRRAVKERGPARVTTISFSYNLNYWDTPTLLRYGQYFQVRKCTVNTERHRLVMDSTFGYKASSSPPHRFYWYRKASLLDVLSVLRTGTSRIEKF